MKVWAPIAMPCLVVAASLALLACDSPSNPAADLADGADAADIPVVLDVPKDTAPDPAADADAIVPPDGDGDLAGDEGTGGDATDAVDGADAFDASDADADSGPGLVPCAKPGDCLSGICSDSPDGKVCSPLCSDEACPAGWGCRSVTVAGTGRIDVCLYPHLEACRPCRDDAECGSLAGLFTNHCLDLGPEGRFCGSACGADTDCPDGYRCAFFTLGSGQSAWQCRRKGPCTCNEKAIAQEASTDCRAENDFGTCLGTRSCTAEGLTACSATTPRRETCDTLDNDCDGLTDPPDSEGCTPHFVDGDADSYGAESAGCLCATGAGTATTPGDCDDGNDAVSPGATEACNGVDDDCDGFTDEADSTDCRTYWPDLDSDSFGSGDLTMCLCAAGQGFTADKAGDCDDAAAAVFPGSPEACNDVDDDCDGGTDPEGSTGCTPYRKDADRDGFGTAEIQCLCHPEAPFDVTGDAIDCDDSDVAIFPGAAEVCNGKDDDCDGTNDPDDTPGCLPRYPDADGDAHGAVGSTPRCLCGPDGIHASEVADDCRDDDGEVYPGRPEICNGKDDDCDGSTDPEDAGNCTVYSRDVDADQYGDASTAGRCLCATEGVYLVTDRTDCNDADPKINPGVKETCNRKDDDCNGLTDDPDGLPGSTRLYYDGDGDGWGVGTSRMLCFPIPPWNASSVGDCDDANGNVSPGKLETCNGYDDNCDGYTDGEGSAGCTWYHRDQDRDGFGSEYQKCLCAVTGDWDAASSTDCCDSDANALPGQEGWFEAANACGDWDYDCDTIQAQQFTVAGGHCDTATCTATVGWLGMGTVPACGAVGSFVVGCASDGGGTCLGDDRVPRLQPCR